MDLIIERQEFSLHMDHVCDLCREKRNPEILIQVKISRDAKKFELEKQQLIVCVHCLGRLANAAHDYLGRLVMGIDEKEIRTL